MSRPGVAEAAVGRRAGAAQLTELADLTELAEAVVASARVAGAGFADARVVVDEVASLSWTDDAPSALDQHYDAGIAVRSYLDGQWGFAATSRLDRAERVARVAADIARSANPMPPTTPPILLPAAVDSWVGPCRLDPFAVPLDDKLNLLAEAAARQRRVVGVRQAQAFVELTRRRSVYASTDGRRLDQRYVICGGGLAAVAVGERGPWRRSWPSIPTGHHALGGWEVVESLDLVGRAEAVATEAVQLAAAEPVEAEYDCMIVDAPLTAILLHETLGHALELDRILGTEASFAGGSFLGPNDRGRRIGSAALTLWNDPTVEGSAGALPYDDEGVPTRSASLIEGGRLTGFLSSRDTAHLQDGLLTGSMRAAGWANQPLIRMGTLRLLGGSAIMAELVADTPRGLLLEGVASWSVDDQRERFTVRSQSAWVIDQGRRVRQHRGAVIEGRTSQLWPSLTDVAVTPEVWTTAACGKGDPPQRAYVSHEVAPTRFVGVSVGGR